MELKQKYMRLPFAILLRLLIVPYGIETTEEPERIPEKESF